jgi:hypothetical protein
MNLIEWLSQESEEVPDWLMRFKAGDPFPRQDFFGSRIVYYPGSGTDGHPVKVFGSSHAAHCFVYVDYMVSRERLERELADPIAGFRGYHSLARVNVSRSEIVPPDWPNWSPHAPPPVPPYWRPIGPLPVPPNWKSDPAIEEAFRRWPKEAAVKEAFRRLTKHTPFAFLEVLERNDGLDDAHGARRLAILFLYADGIAAYHALFCSPQQNRPPFAILLHDHGFGGNYDRFGSGGLLEYLALRSGYLPKYLFVASNTEAWLTFRRIPNLDGHVGGADGGRRFLFERDAHPGT